MRNDSTVKVMSCALSEHDGLRFAYIASYIFGDQMTPTELGCSAWKDL